MKYTDINKDYWIFWYGSYNDIEGHEIFLDFDDMKRYSAAHSKVNKHVNGYFSTYDKVVFTSRTFYNIIN